MKISKIILLILVSIFFGCGSLGGFDIRTFDTKKKNIECAIDSFYSKYPEYRMPDKWKTYDFWDSAGYGFLDTRMFYFNSSPEEMYYVSFLKFPDSNSTSIAIRSVFDGKRWVNEDNTSRHEKYRIENRFDSEIVSKLEKYSNSNAIRGN